MTGRCVHCSLSQIIDNVKPELELRHVYHQKTHQVEDYNVLITLLSSNLVHQIHQLDPSPKGFNNGWKDDPYDPQHTNARDGHFARQGTQTD